MTNSIKKYILCAMVSVNSGTFCFFEGWSRSDIYPIINIGMIMIPFIAQEIRRDPHADERNKVLIRQTVEINKLAIERSKIENEHGKITENQKLEENRLYLQRKKLELEIDRVDIAAKNLETISKACKKCITAVKAIAELLPLVPPAERTKLEHKITHDVEDLIQNRCGFITTALQEIAIQKQDQNNDGSQEEQLQ